MAQELWVHRDRAFSALGPTYQSTPGGWLFRKNKIKYQGQYADYIFVLLTQLQNCPHGSCWKIFRRKKGRDCSRSSQGRKTAEGVRHVQEPGVSPQEESACAPGHCSHRGWLGWDSNFSEMSTNLSPPKLRAASLNSISKPLLSNQAITIGPA